MKIFKKGHNRKDKEMIKVNHEDLGELEITKDRPFYYKGKYVTFEELVKLNSKLSNPKELSLRRL